MGFLKKSSAPSELPDLAIDNLSEEDKPKGDIPTLATLPPKQNIEVKPTQSAGDVSKKPVAGEDYLEFMHEGVIPDAPAAETTREKVEEKKEVASEAAEAKAKEESGISSEIKKDIEKTILEADGKGNLYKSGFFGQVLDDINDEIKDLGNLEDWYEKKFLKQDVVSDMKGYWEGNKSDILIQSFGAEYKKEINEKIKILQALEEDWREIYFKLIKKEEEMKKEERELKETLSEFVDLCKRRRDVDGTKNKNKKSS